MAKLTAARARVLTEPGMHGDGGGLYLKVSRSGARSWIQRATVAGRRRDMGLGRFPDVGLAQAREAAARNRALIAGGGDPLAERRKAVVPTFREAARRVFEANRPRWRNGKYTATWRQSLERHVFPAIGGIPLNRINRMDVLSVLTPIWGAKPETARRVRQRIRAVLKWAMAHGYIESNAAGEAIEGALPPMPRIRNHLRALPYGEVGGLIEAARRSQASLAAKWCLEFLILTPRVRARRAARHGRKSTWTPRPGPSRPNA